MDLVQATKPAIANRLIANIGRNHFLLLVTLGLLLVTSLPSIYGYVSTPDDKWFPGIVYNVHDTAQYFSWMRESGERLFIENKLTSEENNPIFLNLHWWIPGRLAALTGLSLSQIYQLYRLLAIPFLTLAIYAFCTNLFEEVNRRHFAFLLTILTSGLGWIWVVLKQVTGELQHPTDVYTTTGNSFYVMAVSPFQASAVALTLLVLLIALQGIRQKRFGWSVGAGFLALFLGSGHIYDLVTVWAVLGVFGLLLTLRDGWSWRVFLSLGVIVFISAPIAAYWGWVSSDANPMWQQALAQYDNLGVFTPDPLHLIILLGLSFIVGLITFKGFVPLHQQSDGQLLIKSWFCVTPLLVYLPLHFQIMLLTGYQLPLAVVATWGLFDHIFPWLQERLGWLNQERIARLLPICFLLAVLPANLYLLAWRVGELRRHDYPYYLYQDDAKAMAWLDENTQPDDVVLSSFTIGHYLPGLSGNKAFLSNAVMTMNFNHKWELAQKFYDSQVSDEERLAMLQTYQIDYVFHGPAERQVGAYDPQGSSLFEPVFETPLTSVYRVAANGVEQ